MGQLELENSFWCKQGDYDKVFTASGLKYVNGLEEITGNFLIDSSYFKLALIAKRKRFIMAPPLLCPKYFACV